MGMSSRHELRFTHAFHGGTDTPGSVYVYPEQPPDRVSGMVADTGDALADWLGQFLAEPKQQDVASALRRATILQAGSHRFDPGTLHPRVRSSGRSSPSLPGSASPPERQSVLARKERGRRSRLPQMCRPRL
jgi:hypothetical protein